MHCDSTSSSTASRALGWSCGSRATDELLEARYASREPLAAAVEAVFGEHSIERDRDKYPWREIRGRISDVLSGRLDARFAWPPRDDEDVRGFETSMAAGCAPIIEALREARETVFDSTSRRDGPETGSFQPARRQRWLDVGGGDGTVAEALLREGCTLSCDVYNLHSVAPLVTARARSAGLQGRLGFIGGNFLCEALPVGYEVLSFIRVLHDWPADVARLLLCKARQALAPGGRIIICEEFRTGDSLAVQLFWTYFLIGVDACVSRLREVEWYTRALTTLGFTDILVIHGTFDIITAVAA